MGLPESPNHSRAKEANRVALSFCNPLQVVADEKESAWRQASCRLRQHSQAKEATFHWCHLPSHLDPLDRPIQRTANLMNVLTTSKMFVRSIQTYF